jgi:hypothetical protein
MSLSVELLFISCIWLGECGIVIGQCTYQHSRERLSTNINMSFRADEMVISNLLKVRVTLLGIFGAKCQQKFSGRRTIRLHDTFSEMSLPQVILLRLAGSPKEV